ncbi:MAG: hypothetical protein NTU98_08000 [Bacteroidetes bacterium]|nr:hypothetical protein [Bacteroidota bacterium]
MENKRISEVYLTLRIQYPPEQKVTQTLPSKIHIDLVGIYKYPDNQFYYYKTESYKAEGIKNRKKIIINEKLSCSEEGQIDSVDVIYLMDGLFPHNKFMGACRIDYKDVTSEKKRSIRKEKLEKIYKSEN